MEPQANIQADGNAPELDTTQVDATEAQPEQGAPVTRQELAAAIEDGFRRAQQSAKSRTQKIEQQVQGLTDYIKKLNVEVTPDIAERLREQATAQVDQVDQQAQTEASPEGVPSSGNPVYDWTVAFYKTEGIEIKPADPEFQAIKAALGDPNGNMLKYQRVVMKAIDQKRERTASASETAAARVLGSGGGTSGQAPAKSAHSMWERAHK